MSAVAEQREANIRETHAELHAGPCRPDGPSVICVLLARLATLERERDLANAHAEQAMVERDTLQREREALTASLRQEHHRAMTFLGKRWAKEHFANPGDCAACALLAPPAPVDPPCAACGQPMSAHDWHEATGPVCSAPPAPAGGGT